MRTHYVTGLAAGLGAASIWGGMYVVSKVVLDVVPPFALLASRLILGAAALGLVAVFRHARLPARKRTLAIFGTGAIGYGISLGFQFVGTKLSTASNGALVTSATPAFILLFAPFLLGEKTTPRRLIALVVATLGVAAVVDPRSAELSPSLFAGNMSLLAAALTWALYSVLVRKVARGEDPVISTAVMLVGGLPTSLVFGAIELGSTGIATGSMTVGIVGGILFLGLVCTAVAMFLWNYAFTALPAAVASLTFFAQPVVGTVLGVLFLGEVLTPLFLAGGALIAVGLVVAGSEG